METKSLYHIDTDTLITLNPKGMVLDVRRDFKLSFRIEKIKFTVLYLLCISHPHLVTYEEITDILSTVDIKLESEKEINSVVRDLKKELRSYKVKNLIVSVKSKGFAISNTWVEPNDSITQINRRSFIDYIRKLCAQVT